MAIDAARRAGGGQDGGLAALDILAACDEPTGRVDAAIARRDGRRRQAGARDDRERRRPRDASASESTARAVTQRGRFDLRVGQLDGEWRPRPSTPATRDGQRARATRPPPSRRRARAGRRTGAPDRRKVQRRRHAGRYAAARPSPRAGAALSVRRSAGPALRRRRSTSASPGWRASGLADGRGSTSTASAIAARASARRERRAPRIVGDDGSTSRCGASGRSSSRRRPRRDGPWRMAVAALSIVRRGVPSAADDRRRRRRSDAAVRDRGGRPAIWRPAPSRSTCDCGISASRPAMRTRSCAPRRRTSGFRVTCGRAMTVSLDRNDSTYGAATSATRRSPATRSTCTACGG